MVISTIHADYPLVELHRHLDGNVRLQTILEIGLANNLPLPARSLEELRPFVQVTKVKPSILEFFEKFEWLTRIMVDYDAVRRIAYENVCDAKNEGIDYIELRFSPWFMAEKNKLNPSGVVEAVVDGVKSGSQDTGVKTNLIGIISRTYGPDFCMNELQALLAYREDITALDLAGDEINFPGSMFVTHFNKAREAGWHVCPHAGEASGPESIWQAINDFGAERIGHAVSAVQDTKLMEFMAKNQITIESSLTSNVQTSTVANFRSHPIKTFFSAGIPVTINTDDPGISNITLRDEFNRAAVQAGLTSDEIFKIQMNALEYAFLSQNEKNELIEKKENKPMHNKRNN